MRIEHRNYLKLILPEDSGCWAEPSVGAVSEDASESRPRYPLPDGRRACWGLLGWCPRLWHRAALKSWFTMRHIIVICFLVLLSAESSWAQPTSDIHQQTAPPADARYEIVQSVLAARLTFRLDRFTGHIAQLVRTSSDENAWQEMDIVGLPSISAPGRTRFQIFTSGLAAKFTFPLDTSSGKTWVMVTGKRRRSDGTEYEENSWQPFTE